MQLMLKRLIDRLPPGLRRSVVDAAKSGRRAAAKAGLLGNPFLSARRFKVDFKRASMDGQSQFVPLYAAHRPAARAVLRGKRFEPLTHALIGQVLRRRPGDMVHAGAFFGDMLPSFSSICPGRVFAFEPVLENYVLARLCVNENDLENVILIHAALGEGMGQARMSTGVEDGLHHGGSSSVSERGQITTLLPIDFLRLDDVSVIELDVEGYELNALRGARETLERCLPVVMIEDNEKSCDVFLTSIGYRMVGKIPGLFVWAPERDVDWVTVCVADVRGQRD